MPRHNSKPSTRSRSTTKNLAPINPETMSLVSYLSGRSGPVNTIKKLGQEKDSSLTGKLWGGEIAHEQVVFTPTKQMFYSSLSSQLLKEVVRQDTNGILQAKAQITLAQLPIVGSLSQGEMPTKEQLRTAYQYGIRTGIKLVRKIREEGPYIDQRAIGLAANLAILLMCQRHELLYPSNKIPIASFITQQHANRVTPGSIGWDVSIHVRPMNEGDVTPEKKIRVRHTDNPDPDVICMTPYQALGLDSDYGNIPGIVLSELSSEAALPKPNSGISQKLDERYARLGQFLSNSQPL